MVSSFFILAVLLFYFDHDFSLFLFTNVQTNTTNFLFSLFLSPTKVQRTGEIHYGFQQPLEEPQQISTWNEKTENSTQQSQNIEISWTQNQSKEIADISSQERNNGFEEKLSYPLNSSYEVISNTTEIEGKLTPRKRKVSNKDEFLNLSFKECHFESEDIISNNVAVTSRNITFGTEHSHDVAFTSGYYDNGGSDYFKNINYSNLNDNKDGTIAFRSLQINNRCTPLHVDTSNKSFRSESNSRLLESMDHNNSNKYNTFNSDNKSTYNTQQPIMSMELNFTNDLFRLTGPVPSNLGSAPFQSDDIDETLEPFEMLSQYDVSNPSQTSPQEKQSRFSIPLL